MNLKKYIVSLCLTVGSLACASLGASSSSGISLKAPSTFTESDLIGTWNDWNNVDNDETLTLHSDYTFEQIYESSSSGYRYEGEGTWSVEIRPSGCVYLHLEGMKYFHLTASAADLGNRHLDGSLINFWEPCEEQSITMPDKVILLVTSFADFPRGIALELLMTERNRLDRLFILNETVNE